MAQTELEMARALNRALRDRGVTVAVAEGTTGGRIGERLGRYPGATAYFRGSVVTYDYPSRTTLLGIPQDLLREHGSVSAPATAAMAEAVRERFGTSLGLASSGSAGPTGTNVGIAWLAIADGRRTLTRRIELPLQGRVALQAAFTAEALRFLLETVEGGRGPGPSAGPSPVRRPAPPRSAHSRGAPRAPVHRWGAPAASG